VRPVSARDGTGDGRGELPLSPSLAGRAAPHRRAGREARRRVCAGRMPAIVRQARDRTRGLPGRRLVAASQRPPSICAHDKPSRSGPPHSRDDLQPTGGFGRLGRGCDGLPAPRRGGGGGRRRRLRNGCRRRRRGLLDARRGRRRLRLHRSRCGGGGGHGKHNPGTLGQERERVEIPLLLRGAPNAQVNVRLARDRVGALADRADTFPLGDLISTLHGGRSELEQRHRIPVAGADRQRPSARGNGPDERHGPRGGCAHRLAECAGDVDPAVLSSRVRVRAEDEGSEQRSVERPTPRLRAARNQQREQRARDEHEPTHRRTSFVVSGVNDRTSNVAAASAVVTGDDANVERSLRSCYRERS
jgi:hypothetical protein